MSNNRPRRPRRPRPDGAPVPQDFKAPRKTAAQREAEGIETVSVEYGGVEFDIPADTDDWPTLAMQAMSKNRHIDAIEHLLGPKQWAIFIARFPRQRSFGEFAQIIADEMGFGTAGN